MAVPPGGSLLWVQLNPAADGNALYRKALDNRIAILPGSVCSAGGVHRNYIRIGCGYPFTEAVENGIRTLGRLAAEAASAGVNCSFSCQNRSCRRSSV